MSAPMAGDQKESYLPAHERNTIDEAEDKQSSNLIGGWCAAFLLLDAIITVAALIALIRMALQ